MILQIPLARDGSVSAGRSSTSGAAIFRQSVVGGSRTEGLLHSQSVPLTGRSYTELADGTGAIKDSTGAGVNSSFGF